MDERPTLAAWWDELAGLDWYYWSSEGKRWKDGSQAVYNMRRRAEDYGTQYYALFRAWELACSGRPDAPPTPPRPQ